jgi:transcriptional regulator with XRE-family HTH domain
MSDPNTLGGLVRRRRLESGYSLGQLASKVGKTASEVRAWERDDELPEHGILQRLAETLELDLAKIQARVESVDQVGVEGGVKSSDEVEVEDPAEPGEAVADIAKEAEPEEARAAEDESSVEEPADAVGDPEGSVDAATEPGEDSDDEPGFAVVDPFTPPGAADEVDEKPEFDLLDAPTEPVPVPVITDTAAAARAERAVAVLEEPRPLPNVEPAPDSDPGLLRYLEPARILFDPENRYLYWIRAGLTVAVMLVFAVILFDQLGKLLDAVSELLDTIEPSATTPDELDAVGLIN